MSVEPIIASKDTKDEPIDTVSCSICRRQFSKYTCPTCNIPYCSLTCFRSEAHSQCSETFYRKEVETGIHSEPTKSAEEKMKMLELLKRLEQQSLEEDQDLLEGSENDGDVDADLAQRIGDVDFDSVSSDALWEMLKPEERDKFMKILQNPSSDLAQQLLASEELESEQVEPWWEAPSIQDQMELEPFKRYGSVPEIMPMPSTLSKVPVTGSPLIYNICAVFIAYAYATRHLSTSPLSSLDRSDPDYQEAKNIFTQLVPFLTARHSQTLHKSLEGVIMDMWSRFEIGKIDASLMSLLLHDAACMLRPKVVSVLSSEPDGNSSIVSSHPNITSVRALSDISGLFSSSSSPQNHKTLKVSFYATHIISTPPPTLTAISNEMVKRADGMEKEAAHKASNTSLRGSANMADSPNGTTKPRIEEVS